MDLVSLFDFGWSAIQKIVGMAGGPIFGALSGPIFGALIAGLVGIRVADHNSRRDKESKRTAVTRALLAEMCNVVVDLYVMNEELQKAVTKNASVNHDLFAIVSTPIDTTIYKNVGHDIAALPSGPLAHAVGFHGTLRSFKMRIEILKQIEPKRSAHEMAGMLRMPWLLGKLVKNMQTVAEGIPACDLPEGYDELVQLVGLHTEEMNAFPREPDPAEH